MGTSGGMNDEMTIDELAARTGIASRTIRQYQTAGVLAPPLRRGRVGVYAQAHAERLVAIQRLQERGSSLAGMQDLFDAAEHGRALHHVIGTTGSEPSPAVDEAPTVLNLTQLVDLVAVLANAAMRRKAQAAGLIQLVPKQPDVYLVRSLAALRSMADLIEQGIKPLDAIDVYAALRVALAVPSRNVAAMISGIDDSTHRAEFLRRNRALLGQSAATFMIEAVGAALDPTDVASARIGAVQRSQQNRPDRRRQ